MDDRTREEELELAWQEIAGYLNFSTGLHDPKFFRNLNDVFAAIEAETPPGEEAWRVFFRDLDRFLVNLSRRSSAFRDVQQAHAVVELAVAHVLPAYRAHHRDLLHHQTDAQLFRPLFLGHVFEAILRQGPPWERRERIIKQVLAQLNDFLGHRPVAVLETEQKIEPYPHERVRPLPLYMAEVGVESGRYHDLIEKTLEILEKTPPALLDAAHFAPESLEELAVDPRAYDFNHPANKRPNYHFGQWDPHRIDNRGQYRRFVLAQVTLDAIVERIEQDRDLPREELLFEGAAVLAGTMLMAAGTSGSGPDSHDSTVTLATLLPRIAAYRDAFYQELMRRVSGNHAIRLRTEAAQFKQPFAAARQQLNLALSRHRAFQLQNVHLALIYARLGFPAAAARAIRAVPAASARMMCDIECRLAETRRSLERGQSSESADELNKVFKLIRRSIHCGALVDPWNVLGFGGQFSLFPAVENSIPDHRVDELLDLMEELFMLYSRVWAAAAAADEPELQEKAANDFFDAAVWFDRYATPLVSQVKRVLGIEAHVAAQFAAGALNAWHKAGTAAGDVAFWRPHAEQFDSWQAYATVVSALLDQRDYTASLALLVHWAGQADRVRLGEGTRGFNELALRWLNGVLCGVQEQPAKQTLIRRFFDHLEANAEEFWQVPTLELGEATAKRRAEESQERIDSLLDLDEDDEDETEEFDEELDEDGEPFPDELAGEEGEEDEDSDLYGAAYQEMVYRDSTDDGVEGEMVEGSNYATDYELEYESQRLCTRLEFLTTLARSWKIAAPLFLSGAPAPGGKSTPQEVLLGWFNQARANRHLLIDLLRDVQGQSLDEGKGAESRLEYDRRRVVKESLLERIIGACVATTDALRWIAGVRLELEPRGTVTLPKDSGLSVEVAMLWNALTRGDAAAVRDRWPTALAALRRWPLLYVPLSKGGDPQKIIAARSAQHAVTDLLRRLPRLGLLRETMQLISAARAMEQEHSVGAGAVSEFDRLFDVGYKALVESLVEVAARGKPAKEGSDSPDEILISHLQHLTEALVAQWLAHSRTLRLSVLERVGPEREWLALREFIKRYGSDIFTQQFLNPGNLRAILHQGLDHWLRQLSEQPETSEWTLTKELGNEISFNEAQQQLTLIFEAIIENFAEYRDYNTTTTHSDKGETIYTLLDLLRLKCGYERIHWNLKPLIMAHEVLVRRGREEAAELWQRAIGERTSEAADQHMQRLEQLQKKHSLRLVSVADRIGERFVRPLVIDRLRALIGPALQEARSGSASTAFNVLEKEAGELASEPGGAGLEVPDWIVALEEEVTAALASHEGGGCRDAEPLPPRWRALTWDEVESQLANWDTLSLPGGEGKE